MPTINLGKKKKQALTTNRKENNARHNDPRYEPMRKEKLRLNPYCEICKTAKSDGTTHKQHFPTNIPLTEKDKEVYYNIDSVWATCDPCRRKVHNDHMAEGHLNAFLVVL